MPTDNITVPTMTIHGIEPTFERMVVMVALLSRRSAGSRAPVLSFVMCRFSKGGRHFCFEHEEQHFSSLRQYAYGAVISQLQWPALSVKGLDPYDLFHLFGDLLLAICLAFCIVARRDLSFDVPGAETNGLENYRALDYNIHPCLGKTQKTGRYQHYPRDQKLWCTWYT